MRKILKYSFIFSIIFQIISIIITFNGNLIEVSENKKELKTGMILENIVQYIELTFYILMIVSLKHIKLDNITIPRYLDWIITTPLMLLSTIIIMKYFENNKNNTKQNTVYEIIKKNKITLIKIFIYNLLMLLCGYLGEIGIISKFHSVLIGFLFFTLLFIEIYNNFVNNIYINKQLFVFIVTIWSFYGIAALLPNTLKNIFYNKLDIIAKNCYALFIYYKLKYM